MATIRKFRDRKPELPSKWYGVELQFYERFPEADEVIKVKDEEGIEEDRIVMYAYKEYKLPWREEFNQKAEYDENGENGDPIKQDYITEHFDELLAEAKQF